MRSQYSFRTRRVTITNEKCLFQINIISKITDKQNFDYGLWIDRDGIISAFRYTKSGKLRHIKDFPYSEKEVYFRGKLMAEDVVRNRKIRTWIT